MAVILLTPLPTYVVLLLMDGVPMRDPHDGVRANGVALTRSGFSHFVMTLAVLMAVKQAVFRTCQSYSMRGMVQMSLWAVCVLESTGICTAFLWRYPIPFREIIFVPLWTALVIGANWYFAKEAILSRAQAMIRYIPLISTQFVFFYGLLVLALAYSIFSMTVQIILTALFPLVRIICRRSIWRQARNSDDISTDLTMCLLEITAALYQTISLQFAKTPVLTVVIMVSDLIPTMIEVREYLGLEYLVDSTSTLSTVVKIIKSGMSSGLTERHSITVPIPLGPSASKYLKDSALLFSSESSIASVYVQRDHIRKANSRRLLDLKQFEDKSEHSDTGESGCARVERCLSTPNFPTAASPSPAIGDLHPSQPMTIEGQASRRTSLQGITFEYGNMDSPSRRTSLSSLRLPPIQQKRMSGGSVGRHQIHPIGGNEETSGIPDQAAVALLSPSKTLATSEPSGRRRSTGVMIDGVAISRKDQARILEQTLQLLFSCEVLLVSEYFEVMIPFYMRSCY
ncbi:hypothetical protein Poli38472_007942 [Pythium oligandrum]|uniref:Transmembrane protein n=1 Tax=Pythium oligandrum TaxID=41045 RepID=A0A8K1CMF2_PYTOL|nr:hypothetical protein Poli38472_007942 [Pythium oligandrum]|eukprot:TMW65300.1 hypothetical protein Poli38472_007942 [Pythium oligandrum]